MRQSHVLKIFNFGEKFAAVLCSEERAEQRSTAVSKRQRANQLLKRELGNSGTVLEDFTPAVISNSASIWSSLPAGGNLIVYHSKLCD